MTRVVRAASASMTPYAICDEDDCQAEWPMSAMTRDNAKRHVKETGHKVLVVTETRDLYRLED